MGDETRTWGPPFLADREGSTTHESAYFLAVNRGTISDTWATANAEKYGIDPLHMGAVGFSAGGHLSMMLGTMDKEDGLDDSGANFEQSSKVQAVVSFYGPTDVTTPYPDATKPILKKWLGGTVECLGH